MGTRRRGTVARTAASGAPWARHGTAPPRPAPPGLPATAPASCGEVSFQRTSVFSLRTVTDLKSRGTGDGFFWGGFFFFGLLFFYPDVAADQRYLHVWG